MLSFFTVVMPFPYFPLSLKFVFLFVNFDYMNSRYQKCLIIFLLSTCTFVNINAGIRFDYK